jgi:hypothetical protein
MYAHCHKSNNECLQLYHSIHSGLCAYDSNLLEDNIYTTMKNKEALTEASMEVGLEVYPGKTKYMLMSITRMQHKIIT